MPILSGMQPSGPLHLGNYLGALRPWVEAQDPNAYYCVVDLHALTLEIEPKVLRRQSTELLATYLAAGLDPEVCTIFLQSAVPYHAQLNWLLECVATYGELTRMVAFKEKAARQGGQRVGLLTYPVLMAADILLYESDRVPVGDDQRQHLELTRDLAQRFNHRYGDTFVVPVGTQPSAGARVMDLQEPTRKMSKSVSSPLGKLNLFDEPRDVERKIARAVTDTDGQMRFDWATKPGLANLLEIFAAITGETPVGVASRFGRYGELKEALAATLVDTLAPMRERYVKLLASPEALDEVAARGAERAGSVAGPVYRRAARAVGLP